ncbi:MAG: hypothetical protein JW700_04075 [Candidatus Aenigmarchaeota archaeon]|nr:hypothetical protein [Candidatus Aenigmarchaeota archaeon]
MNHLEELIKQGFLVEEDAKESIEKIDEKAFDKLIKHLKQEKPFIVTGSIVDKILAEDIEIIKQFEEKKVFTVQDYVNALNKRYGFLQDLLMKKVELKNIVSINKVSQGPVSVIGMVKDIVAKNSGKTVVMEDPTGYIDVVMDSKMIERLVLDDVIAVFGQAKNKVVFAEKVLFPSIPLRPVNLSKKPIKVAFSDKKLDVDYVVSKDCVFDNKKQSKHKVSSPYMFSIGNINIMFLTGAKPIDILNKRYLNINRIDFLIDPIPDVIFTDQEISMSYKGVSIVPKNSIIDLMTRKIEKIEQKP